MDRDKEKYLRCRDSSFVECGLKPNDKERNCHHDYFRYDLKKHLIPRDFPINDRSNLTPLLKDIHEEMHWIIDNDVQYRDIRLRKYMANMAFNEELDLIPSRKFYSDPLDMMRKH